MTLYTWFDRLIAAAERKFGWLALPNLLRWVALFQILTFFLAKLSPDFAEALSFDARKIFTGEVWRLVGFIALPSTGNVLLLLLGVMVLFWINDGMEQAWGSFRVCLYVLLSSVSLMVAGLVFFFAPNLISALGGIIWYEAIFLAFATLYPDLVMRLYFVIPVRVKYLGWIGGAMLVFLAVSNLVTALVVLAGIWPYLCVFLPTLLSATFGQVRQRGRRTAFQKETAPPESLHRCHRCGVTDTEAPQADFRVANDGEEYCQPCREARRREAAAG